MRQVPAFSVTDVVAERTGIVAPGHQGIRRLVDDESPQNSYYRLSSKSRNVIAVVDKHLDICLNIKMSADTQSVFKALADPTRREILRHLQSGSRTAGSIAELFPMTRASLSHHFNILKAAELVRTERRGQHIVYSLNATVLQETIAMMMNMFSYDDSMPRNDEEKRRRSE